MANLHPRKRVGDLIEALAPWCGARVPDVDVAAGGLAATWPPHAALLERASRAGVADVVSFAGHIADVVPEMAQARVVALPSSCEGVPTVLLEGMAAGRPVVATRSGHVESIVADGIEGFLVPVGDVAGLADRLIRLLSDTALADRMSRSARNRAMRYDVQRIARTLLEALMGVASMRPFATAGGR